MTWLQVPGLGELAAVTTSVTWAACARYFAAAGERIGSVAVNHLRLVAALVLLSLLHAVLADGFAPRGVPAGTVLLFALSGVVGLVLGDACLFRAWVLIGPTRGALVMTTAPGWAALMALFILGEGLRPAGWVGLLLGLVGVAVAIAARGGPGLGAGGLATNARETGLGLLLAGLGALGQAGGVVLARPALAEVPAISGTWLRMLAAVVALWGFSALRSAWRRRRPAWMHGLRGDPKALLLTLAGTLTGPVLGVWLSLVATKHASVAVAATLMSMTPLVLLMVEWWSDGRRPKALELIGAGVAVAGVCLLVGAPR